MLGDHPNTQSTVQTTHCYPRCEAKVKVTAPWRTAAYYHIPVLPPSASTITGYVVGLEGRTHVHRQPFVIALQPRCDLGHKERPFDPTQTDSWSSSAAAQRGGRLGRGTLRIMRGDNHVMAAMPERFPIRYFPNRLFVCFLLRLLLLFLLFCCCSVLLAMERWGSNEWAVQCQWHV